MTSPMRTHEAFSLLLEKVVDLAQANALKDAELVRTKRELGALERGVDRLATLLGTRPTVDAVLGDVEGYVAAAGLRRAFNKRVAAKLGVMPDPASIEERVNKLLVLLSVVAESTEVEERWDVETMVDILNDRAGDA